MKKIITLLPIITLLSCVSIPTKGESEHKFAWYHGSCIALKAEEINLDSKVYLLDENKGLIEAVVIEKAKDDRCLALLDNRKEANLSAGYTFYRIQGRDSPISDSNIGVAILGSEELKDKSIDINNNSQADQVGLCTTSEGVKFYAWDSESTEEAPFWEEYYYLGYDTEATCEV